MLFLDENKEVKPVEIVLRMERGGKRENNGRGYSVYSKIYCKHMCKYHSVSPCTTILCK
jgi:hypothetical protein